LKDEINLRKQSKKPFKEEELLYIALTVIGALDYLTKTTESHGAISPNSIFFSKEGKCLIANHGLIIGKKFLDFHKILGNPKTCYLSPLLFKDIYKLSSENGHNPAKSDVFSLGIVSFPYLTNKRCYIDGSFHLSIPQSIL